MKGSFFAGYSLNNESSIFIYQNCHVTPPRLRLL
jgi:hypothetical protein